MVDSYRINGIFIKVIWWIYSSIYAGFCDKKMLVPVDKEYIFKVQSY